MKFALMVIIFHPLAESDLGGVTYLQIGQLNRWLEAYGIQKMFRSMNDISAADQHQVTVVFDRGELSPRETM